MPLIEELPTSGSQPRPSHGWTYVADNGPGAHQPTAPLVNRKRVRDIGPVASAQVASRLSAKQEKAIQQRLDDLGKENHRDVQIAVPKREGAGRAGKDRKTTQNVRRILAYSRTFQHYLADEEAGVNVYGSAGVIAANATASVQAQIGRADLKKRVGAAAGESAAASKGTTKRTASSKKMNSAQVASTSVKKEKEAASTEDVEMSEAQPSAPAVEGQTTQSPQQNKPRETATTTIPTTNQSPYDSSLDHDPLLKTLDLPKMPSARLMAALLSEPPLSYLAARAKPLDEAPPTASLPADSQSQPPVVNSGASNLLLAKPRRHFCAICGYWGKVRCKQGCGERVCGLLECWKAHAGVCSLAGY